MLDFRKSSINSALRKIAAEMPVLVKNWRKQQLPIPQASQKRACTPFYEVDILVKRCRPLFSNGLDDRALACAPIYMALQARKDRK